VPPNRLPKGKKREKISISPDPTVLAWVDANVGLGKRFASRTHAVEFALARLMQEDKRTGKQD
jgi:Arc/MetJ-type ribon-helix-helix transcriptional regulator